jgi:hypothetical protein
LYASIVRITTHRNIGMIILRFRNKDLHVSIQPASKETDRMPDPTSARSQWRVSAGSLLTVPTLDDPFSCSGNGNLTRSESCFPRAPSC